MEGIRHMEWEERVIWRDMSVWEGGTLILRDNLALGPD